MALKLLKNGKIHSSQDPEFANLNAFCSARGGELTFEWIQGQYWLHSTTPKERPIGIEIDRELRRHEEFFKKASLQKELLARAIGIKGAYRPRVLDLTAGMLGDTLLMLSLGCQVWAIERHPVMSFLIQSALQNASHPCLERLHFFPLDALSLLSSSPEVDVIYFDPMFEDVREKTSPRKEMRIFREIVGKDLDAKDVFERAMKLSPKRMVVKRPKASQALSDGPLVEYVGKSIRYDVYFSV